MSLCYIGVHCELIDIYGGQSTGFEHEKSSVKKSETQFIPVFVRKDLWHGTPLKKINDFESVDSHFITIILGFIEEFKEVVMLQKVKLTKKEMKEFAEAFAYYDYGEEEIGMVPLYPGYPDRTKLVKYLLAMIGTANEYDAVYVTSARKEGIIILTDTTHPYPRGAMIKMVWRMTKALGLRDFRRITKKFQAGGASLEKKYRDEKRSFVQIELLAVRTKYQGKGFMRPLVETAFEVAEKAHLPVIVSTDAKLKKDKYEHLGLKHVNTRTLAEKSFMYDLVREA